MKDGKVENEGKGRRSCKHSEAELLTNFKISDLYPVLDPECLFVKAKTCVAKVSV